MEAHELGALSRRRGSAAMPLFLLLLALATEFLFSGGRGHLYQDDTHDHIAQNHMTVALNLSPAHGFLGFYRLTRGADGDLGYEAYNRFPVLGHALIKLATLPFPDDASARLAAARMLMLAFFAAAATLAYLALCRLTGSRWAALTATLLAFSSYYALYYNDMVATEGAIDLFGVMLVLHGIAVFAAEGRFGQLLAKTCTALLLGWHVYALVVPFALLGLAAALRRREWADVRRHLMLGTVAVAFGAMVLGTNLTREYLALDGEVAPMRLPSVVSMLYRTGLFELQAGAGREETEQGGSAEASGRVEHRAWLAVAARQLKRIAWSVPYAVGHFVGDGRPNADLPKGAPIVVLGLALAAVVVVTTLALLLSPATRHRLPLAALALTGPCWAFVMRDPYFYHPFEGMFDVGVPLVFFALVLPRLDRWLGGRVRPTMFAGVVAVPTFALSSFLMARANAPDPEYAAFERALAADVDAIRKELSERPDGKTILISEAMDACGKYRQPARFASLHLNWKYYFTGQVFVKFGDRRLADFVVSEPIDGARTLTPDNQLAFLYDHASHEDALRGYERHTEQNTPVLASPDYDVYFVDRSAGDGARGELLYVRDHCPNHQVNNRFHAMRIMIGGGSRVFVHVWPTDANDLSADRRPFGFENAIDFEQLLSGWRTDGKCYAVCRLPGYDIASVRAGTATSRRTRHGVLTRRTSYDIAWEGSFSPPAGASR